jgi:hypothetical protein
VLGVSVYPGVLNDLPVYAAMSACVALPIVGIVIVMGLTLLVSRRTTLHAGGMTWSRAAVILGLLLGTAALVMLYVPRRIAFAASRPAFEQLLPQAAAAPAAAGQTTPLNRWVGAYPVDHYAADRRGGVYFRVHTGRDGIGPDQMSYGFAHQPNDAGSPFGSAGYRVFPLGGGWYWFRASDDW